MLTTTSLILLITTLLPQLTTAQYRFNLQTAEEHPHTITLFGDFAYPYVMVNKDHFDCEASPVCRWEDDGPEKTDFYMSNEFKYRNAYIDIDFERFEVDVSEKIKISLRVRINDLTNVFGMNDLSFFKDTIPRDMEMQVNLKDLTIKIGEVAKTKSDYFLKDL